MQELVRMYDKGAITAEHLAAESLHKLDPANPGLVLAALPRAVIECVVNYLDQYRPAAMKTNYGLPPAQDQVVAAKHWIETNVVNASAGRGSC